MHFGTECDPSQTLLCVPVPQVLPAPRGWGGWVLDIQSFQGRPRAYCVLDTARGWGGGDGAGGKWEVYTGWTPPVYVPNVLEASTGLGTKRQTLEDVG